MYATLPALPSEPPPFLKSVLISVTVRFLLSVSVSMMMAVPPGP